MWVNSSNGQTPGLSQEQNCRLTGIYDAPRPTARKSWELLVTSFGLKFRDILRITFGSGLQNGRAVSVLEIDRHKS